MFALPKMNICRINSDFIQVAFCHCHQFYVIEERKGSCLYSLSFLKCQTVRVHIMCLPRIVFFFTLNRYESCCLLWWVVTDTNIVLVLHLRLMMERCLTIKIVNVIDGSVVKLWVCLFSLLFFFFFHSRLNCARAKKAYRIFQTRIYIFFYRREWFSRKINVIQGKLLLGAIVSTKQCNKMFCNEKLKAKMPKKKKSQNTTSNAFWIHYYKLFYACS